jgi:hypothetical protein
VDQPAGDGLATDDMDIFQVLTGPAESEPEA